MSWAGSLHKIDPPKLEAIKKYLNKVKNNNYNISEVTGLLKPYDQQKNVPRAVKRLQQMQKEKELVRNLLNNKKTNNNAFLGTYKKYTGITSSLSKHSKKALKTRFNGIQTTKTVAVRHDARKIPPLSLMAPPLPPAQSGQGLARFRVAGNAAVASRPFGLAAVSSYPLKDPTKNQPNEPKNVNGPVESRPPPPPANAGRKSVIKSEKNVREARKAKNEAAAAKAAAAKAANQANTRRLLNAVEAELSKSNQNFKVNNASAVLKAYNDKFPRGATNMVNSVSKLRLKLNQLLQKTAKASANELAKENNTLQAVKEYWSRYNVSRSVDFNPKHVENLLKAYTAAHKGQKYNSNVKKLQKALSERKASNTKAAAEKKAAERKTAREKAAAEKAVANKAAAEKNAAKAALLVQIRALLSSEPLNTARAEKLLLQYNTTYRRRLVPNNANVRALRAKVKAVPPEFNEAAVRKALSNYLVATVKPKYNKALVNAILRQIPNLNENTKRQLIRSQQSVPRRVLGTFGLGAWGATKMAGRAAWGATKITGRALPFAVVGGTSILAAGALTTGAIGAAGLIAVPALLGLGAVATVYQLRKIVANPKSTPAQRAAAQQALEQQNPPTPAQIASAPPSIPFLPGAPIPLGYSLQTNNKGITAYYKNNKALQSQIEKLISQAGPRANGGGGGPRANGGGGGIVFKPQITVGAARIGAQTFGGTRVGGQQMGSQRTSTGNVAGSRATMGNIGGPRATMSNSGPRATMSNSGPRATTGGGVVSTTPEQLIRTAGGSEAVEKAIVALRSANGNVNKARSVSKLPLKTFTNIYAMGGPVAAKKYVQSRRRRRAVTLKKKRVVRKPRKQYIKLTPYQFKRLTEHIKKNNLRKVLIKEITH
jgi:hypothetical protein